MSKLNTQQVPPEYLVPYLLCLWILAFSVPGFSSLFSCSALNALDLYMQYTAEVVPLCTYIVWFTSVTQCTTSVHCQLALLHF